MSKQRIWELDALRGICILGMVVFHLLYDLTELYDLVSWQLPPALRAVQLAGGRVFLVLSGVCVTLGSRPVRRGLIVFSCGLVCTAVTALTAHFGFASQSVVIRFGVLHCLGVCMLLWPLAKKLPSPVLAALGLLILTAGWYLDYFQIRSACRWLFPLGIRYPGFTSGDYFPLLPCLGWFLLGAVAGRRLYRKRQTLLPDAPADHPAFRALCFCGRHSLILYLAHQPLLSGLCMCLRMIL